MAPESSYDAVKRIVPGVAAGDWSPMTPEESEAYYQKNPMLRPEQSSATGPKQPSAFDAAAGWAGVGLFGAAGGLAVAGGILNANAAREQAKLIEQNFLFDAKNYNLTAENVLKNTNKETKLYMQQTVGKTLGAQTAGYAGQGVVVSTGVADLVRSETTYNAQMNVIEMKRRAQDQANGLKVEARQAQSRAAWAKLEGEAATSRSILGGIQALGSMASAGAGLAGKAMGIKG